MGGFESAYEDWLNRHRASAKGERLRRLTQGHGYGEKLLLRNGWWPAFGNFEDLHPEYECVVGDRYYYMDLAYVRLPKPTCLESDGFGVHARDADRDSFSRGLERQNDILLAGWNVLRFSTDKLRDDPRYCQRTLRKMMLEWYGDEGTAMTGLNVYQRDIVRLAARLPDITPSMVGIRLDKSRSFVSEQLKALVQLGLIEPASGRRRVRSYRLTIAGTRRIE